MVYEPPAINVSSTELPGWAVPVLIICGVLIAAAVIMNIIKKKK